MHRRPTSSRANVLGLFLSVCLCGAGLWDHSAIAGDVKSPSATPQSEIGKYAAAVKSAYELVIKGDCSEATRVLSSTEPELRGWEFEYLKGIALDCTNKKPPTRVPGLRGPIMDNGVNIALADPVRPQVTMPCLDGTLRLLDLNDSAGLASGKPKITTAFSTGTQLINGDFSGDGSVYAVGGENGRVFVWRQDGSTEPDSIAIGDKPVTAVAVNKNATRLITEADRGEVILWSLPDQKKIRVLGESWRHGRPVRFSPNGDLIALGGMDKIEILSSERGEALREIGPHGHYVMTLAFSPDGKILASGTRGSIPKSVAIFDVDTGKRILEFNGHTNGITGVAFNRDATRLVSTSGDGTLRFLHLPSGIELLSLHVGAPFGDAHFSGDGRTLLWSGQRGLELIQLTR